MVLPASSHNAAHCFSYIQQSLGLVVYRVYRPGTVDMGLSKCGIPRAWAQVMGRIVVEIVLEIDVLARISSISNPSTGVF